MNLKILSASELHEKLMALVLEERKLTLSVLEHLREVSSRRLYAERGHSSLFEYCVAEDRYSESAAMRRISAMRALKSLPELREQVESGELKVTQLATLQSFVRMEAKAGKTYSIPETRALFQAACGKSTRETEKLLAERNPEFVTREKIRVVSPTQTELTLTADEELMQMLQSVRDRFAHTLPSGAKLADVVRFMAKVTLAQAPEKRESRKAASRAEAATLSATLPAPVVASRSSPGAVAHLTPARSALTKSSGSSRFPSPRSRYIPSAVKREVWTRDEGRCQFISPATGKKCLSTHRIQVDHIVPFSQGGSSTDAHGLRLLCFSHNQWESQRVFGKRRSTNDSRSSSLK